MKESTQYLLVGSVLVATATFGAAFAMPGGFRQDDHPYGGTLSREMGSYNTLKTTLVQKSDHFDDADARMDTSDFNVS